MMKRNIPNFITCLNLFLGCLAVVFALRGWLGFAVYTVIVAAVLDFCDGFAARLLKAYSLLGKELDSLADLISFGLAPAAMMYYKFSQIIGSKINFSIYPSSLLWEFISFFPFIITVAAALRLAKFNVDSTQREHFRGLPTPGAALLICSLLIYVTRTPKIAPILDTYYAIPAITLIISWLMVSNLPMFSLKMKTTKWRGNQLRFLFLFLSSVYVILMFLLEWHVSFTLLLILLSYIAFSLTYILRTLQSKA